MVELRDLAFGYPGAGRPVLERLTLAVPRGAFVAVVGPSGAGKSSLLRVIAGLAAPSQGAVRLLAQPAPGRRSIFLVFQDPRLLPWRRVLGNVAFGLEGLGLVRTERRRRAEEAVALVGLGPLARAWPHQLSGGQQQRVGIARALAVGPELLLMDEPFGALDAITREALQDELLRLRQASGATVVFVTHDLDEAVYLADTVVLLAGQPARIAQRIEVATPRAQRRGAPELGFATPAKFRFGAPEHHRAKRVHVPIGTPAKTKARKDKRYSVSGASIRTGHAVEHASTGPAGPEPLA